MRRLILVALGALLPIAHGDILHLRDGTRYQGELVSESSRETVFRIISSAGASITRRFPAAEVQHVERAPLPETRADRGEPRDEAALNQWLEQMVREAHELLDASAERAALETLQRAVNRASKDQLLALNVMNKNVRGVGLDEMLADLRMRRALAGANGQLFEMRYATPFERPALARRLVDLQERSLAIRFDGRTVAEWAADPSRYTTLTPQTRPLLTAARLANAASGARLDFDPALQAPAARLPVMVQRKAVADLIHHIARLPGFGRLPAASRSEDPTLREAERIEEELRLAQERMDEAEPETSDEPASTPETQPGDTP